MADWIHTKTITGSIADGDKYFRREAIEDALWREIEKGNHILFSAPRRVGKSSIMKYIAENPRDGYRCIYENIQSDGTTEEFYKRVLKLLIKQVKNPKITEFLAILFACKVEEISTDSVRVVVQERNPKEKLLSLLPKLKEEGEKIVLFLDEFPDVIKKISENQNPAAAMAVLHTLRSIRQNENFRDRFVLVFAGSVGLNHVVRKIGRTAIINDLHEENLPALRTNKIREEECCEAEAFIGQLVKGATMQFSPESMSYMIRKLKQAIPYYLQLLVEECNNLLFDENRTQLSNPDIDRAWDKVLIENKHFSDSDERLKEFFQDDYLYFLALLRHCAHKNILSIQESYDMGLAFEIGTEFKTKIDDVLIKDGYLYQEGTNFYFVSPLLKAWWKNRHPMIKEGPKQ